MPDRPGGQTDIDEPTPEALKAAHDALLQLNAGVPPPVAVAGEPPADQPSDHGYDHYDI